MSNDDYEFKKKGLFVKVNNGDIDKALMKLKKLMNSEGINQELRKRRNFVPESVLRRQRMAEAKQRWKKKHAQIFELDLPKKKKKDVKKFVNRTQISE